MGEAGRHHLKNENADIKLDNTENLDTALQSLHFNVLKSQNNIPKVKITTLSQCDN